MQIILTNLGSVGDVQPLLALAEELRKNGHQPVMALAPLFGPRVSGLGFEYVPLGPALDFPEIDRRAIAALMRGVAPHEVMRESLSLLEAMLPDLLDTLLRLCRNADLLVSGHLQPAAQMVHELTQIPFVSVQVNHFGGRRALAEREALGGVVNAFRRRHGLAPLADPLHSDANSPQLALYAISRHLGITTGGWPEHYHLTGFFFLDEEGWQPPTDLVDFLAAGEAPLVFSFSSLSHEDPAAVTEMILAAVRRTGRRAIIQKGWSGLADGEMPREVHAAGFVPHAWLFPRAACVIHHGGAQTSAAVFRAGVPAVVVPHVRDQPIWAALSRDLGISGPPLPSSDLSSESLAAAIESTMENPVHREAAAALSVKVRGEQGVVRARRLIEHLAGKTGLSLETAGVEDLEAEGRMQRLARRAAYRADRRGTRLGAALEEDQELAP
jgi:sterol 3beta-glucosyltransferase